MPILKEALTTLANTKRALGVPQSNQSNDALIVDLINAATLEIQRRTGRKFVRRDFNDGSDVHSTTNVADEERHVLSGDGVSESFILPNFPIVSSGFVLESLATRTSSGDTWKTLTEHTEYKVDYTKGIVYTNGWKLFKGIRNYRITYEAGFKDGSKQPFVPSDLERACHEVVKQEFRGSGTVVAETIAGWSRTFKQDKSEAFVEKVLDRYTSASNFL